MDFDQQLIIRIKSFLSSADLTDSATARELYNAYLDANNTAAARVLECGLLIRKQQKIEAVLAARRQPELFDMLDSLICPERKLLDELADLYNWPRLSALDMETVEELRAEVRAMDDLRPLLTEFRRIARSDRLEEKLHLLREIYRLDKKNPEWHDTLSEVENQYLFRLIAEAKQAIEDKNEDRLTAIHDELHNTNWLVSIPTIVIRKIDKLVDEIRERKLREKAAELLERIDRSVKDAEVVALEDALLCWEKHCRDTGYQPQPAETRQVADATDRLHEEKLKLEEKRKFQCRIEETGELIDRGAPLEDVERCYAAAEAMKLEMPQFIVKRMKRYRSDVIRARRIAAALKGVKIAVTAVILLVIAVGATLLTIQLVTEKKLTAELDKAIRSGDLTKARSMIADIEKHQPKLAKRSKIVRAKAEIKKRQEEENTRLASLNRIIDELNTLLAKPNFRRSVFDSKLAYARELARSDAELGRINECAERGRLLSEELRKNGENRFLAQIRTLSSLRDEAKQLIAAGRESGNFDAAEAKLQELERLAAEAQSGPGLTEKLLGDHGDVLNAGTALRQELEAAKTRSQQIRQCLNDISGASSIAALDLALGNLKTLLATYNDLPAELGKLYETLARDLDVFKKIVNYQNDPSSLPASGDPDSGFFADARKLAAYRRAQSETRRKLLSNFKTLKEEYDSSSSKDDKDKLYLLRFADDNNNGKIFDIYVKYGGDMEKDGTSTCKLTRSDNAKVTVTPINGHYMVTIGSDTYHNCRLLRPGKLNHLDDVYSSQAPHQLIIDDFCEKLLDDDDEKILQVGIDFLKKLRADPLCSAYWKMKLSLMVLDALIPLDMSPGSQLKKLADGFREFDNGGNRNTAMHNEELLDRIETFITRNDISGKLDRAAAINALLYKRIHLAVEQKFIFFGVFLNRKNARKDFTVKIDLPGKTGDIWCFDKRGCCIVGGYSGTGIVPNDLFRDRAEGRLLFTTADPCEMERVTRELLNEQTADELKIIPWPEFWPSNRREE